MLGLLERNLSPERRLEILDAGCGGGATVESLRRYGEVRGMEISGEAVRYNRERGREVAVGSIEQVPFGFGSFDLTLEVIEHVPDDLGALGELFRVLRSGGLLPVTVPALRMLWGAHDVASGHYRRCTLGELRCGVERTGFEVVAATYFNTLLFPVVFAFRTLRHLRPKNGASDVAEIPRPLNSLLTSAFSLEASLVVRKGLPVGVSALCLARKPRGTDT